MSRRRSILSPSAATCPAAAIRAPREYIEMLFAHYCYSLLIEEPPTIVPRRGNKQRRSTVLLTEFPPFTLWARAHGHLLQAMDFLDSAIAHTSSSAKGVEQKLLVQRMQQLLVTKHQNRLAEVMRAIEATSAEIEQLSEAFRDGGGPPEGWRPQHEPEEEEEESESEEDDVAQEEAVAQVELHRVLERPKWKM